MINKRISELIGYGIKRGLLEKEDKIFVTNRILAKLKLDSFTEYENANEDNLEVILKDILSFAVENGLIDDSITEKDIFDTEIMALLLPRPSEVIRRFNDLYNEKHFQASRIYSDVASRISGFSSCLFFCGSNCNDIVC